MDNKKVIKQTPSRSSPRASKRGCLCKDTLKYSVKCCDGTLWAQGIGPIVYTRTYLLDIYKDASSAYSLRQLSAGYSGVALRIRRASDNAELDVYFVDGVVDSESIISFCSGTNGFVKIWYDQSGNNYHATALTNTAQPKIYDISNGYLGYVQFGGNQYLPTTLQYTFDGLIDVYQVVQGNVSGVYGRTNLTNAYFGIYANGISSTTFAGFNAYTNKVNGNTIGTTMDAVHDATVNKCIFSVRANARQSNFMWIGAPFNSAYNNQRFTEFILYKNQNRDASQVIASINDYYKLY